MFCFLMCNRSIGHLTADKICLSFVVRHQYRKKHVRRGSGETMHFTVSLKLKNIIMFCMMRAGAIARTQHTQTSAKKQKKIE